jgi:hypothetical protein
MKIDFVDALGGSDYSEKGANVELSRSRRGMHEDEAVLLEWVIGLTKHSNQ